MGFKWLKIMSEGIPIDSNPEWFDAFMKETETLFIAMVVVFITTIIILVIASKIGSEDFEMIEYLVMTVSVFMITSVWYLIVSLGLEGLFYNNILTETTDFHIQVIIFVSSLIVLFWPFVCAVKSSFMFLKSRMVLAAVLTGIIALGLALYIV